MALNNDVTLKVGFDIDKFQAELKKTNGILGQWESGVKRSLMSVAAGFSALKVAEFAIGISKLAGEAQGVEVAFNRLDNSVQLMIDLKKATNNTVSELELMKRAVMAQNFGISLEALPKLLEFATLRAKQTGQSVDYLVDSIVTGIGRKSKLILDNLGISAVQLTDALGGASAASSTIGEVAEAVGRIAEENLKNMAGFTDDAKTSMDQLGASWENFKVSLGKGLNEAGGAALAKDAATVMDLISSKTVDWTDKIRILATTWSNAGITEELKKLSQHGAQSTWGVQTKAVEDYTVTIASLKEKLSELNEMFEMTDISEKGRLSTIGKDIQDTETLIKKLEELKKAVDIRQIYFDNLRQLKFPESKSEMGFFQGSFGNLGNVYKGVQANEPAMPGKVGAPIDIDTWNAQMEERNKKMQDYIKTFRAIGVEAEEISNSFVNSMQNFAVGFAQTLSDSINNGANFGQSFLRNIAAFMKSFGQQLIALGVAKLGLDKLFTTPVGAAVAIAAGTALVVAAGALSKSAGSSVSSISSGGNSSGYSSGVSSSGVGQREQRIVMVGKVSGKDIVFVYDSAKRDNYYQKGG